MRTTIGGNAVDLTMPQVERALSKIEPEPIRDHFVVVGERRYPVKQALEAASGVDRSDFTSHQARAVFRRLGLELGRSAEGRVGESAPPYGRPEKHIVEGPFSTESEDPSEDPFAWLTESDLRKFDGKWIAVKNRRVIASAPTPDDVVQSLRRRGMRADLILMIGGTISSDLPGVGI